MASDEAVPMDVERNAQLRILVLLDITGSMGREITAVKSASAELVRLSGEEFSGIHLAIAIITFTEEDTGCKEADGSGCYVSLAEFSSLPEAQQYINNIKLCTPPDRPDVDASGDDTAENQKAALYKALELDPTVPTIGFLITDAPPHMATDRTKTAAHERKWLEALGLEPETANDIFRTFAKVQEHFNGSLVVNSVLYNNAAPEIYGNFAQQTGGMLMRPMSRTPQVLARGLADVVRVLLAQMAGEPAELQELEGFALVDVSGLNAGRQTEQDAAGEVRAGDNKAIFGMAMERMVAVAGSKFTRRAIGMVAPSEQLQFVWRASRYIYKASSTTEAASPEELEAELTSLLQLRDSIIKQLPEEHKGHFTISETDIKRLAEEAKAAVSAAGAGGLTGSASVFSLETVGEALADDAVWEDWLAVVMRLLLGFPLTVQLPIDKMGKPDFMDCWSSVMEKMGIDRTSASDFMQLIGDKATAKGFTDRGEYNGFLVVVEPSDKLASLVFRVASGTQVLNYVTGVLLGAPGFLPNMYAGIASAALLRLLSRHTLTGFEWSQAQQILHSLRTLHRNAAWPVTEQLKAGRANPADHPSKLLLAAVRCFPATRHHEQHTATEVAGDNHQQAQAVRLILQEWLATLMQRHYGKSTPESDAAYLATVCSYSPLTLLGPVDIDPLQQLHPLEQPGVPDTFQPDYQDQVLQRLRQGAKGEGKDECDLPAHPVYVQFSRGAKRLLALLSQDAPAAAAVSTSDGSKGYQPSGPDIEAVWPDWEQGVLQALLLRWRTGRYRSTTATTEMDAPAPATAVAKVEVTWEPIEVGSIQDLLLGRLREAAAAQLQGYRSARVAAASKLLTAAAAKVMLAHQHDAAAASAGLQQLYLPIPQQAGQDSNRPEGSAKGPLAVLQGQQVYLQRHDVPSILQKCISIMSGSAHAAVAAGDGQSVTAAMLRALVMGDWCTQGAQALRRASLVLQLCQGLGDEGAEMLDAIKAAEQCQRTGGPNKNGHSSDLQYPGPDGYTDEYAAKRKTGLLEKLAKASVCKKHRKEKKFHLYMESMRKFRDVTARAEAAAAGDDVKLKKVYAVLAEFRDANQVVSLTDRLQSVLG